MISEYEVRQKLEETKELISMLNKVASEFPKKDLAITNTLNLLYERVAVLKLVLNEDENN